MAARLKRTAPIAMPESRPCYEPRDRNLELVGHWALKRLGGACGGPGPNRHSKRGGCDLTEELVLNSGLLFWVLTPIRNRDNTLAVAAGIEAVGREKAAVWLGTAKHRKHPYRALAALRCLLPELKR